MWLLLFQSWVERKIATHVFGPWIEEDDPEHSILVWDRVSLGFPKWFNVIGSRWRNPECLKTAESPNECAVVFIPHIYVTLNPTLYFFQDKMDIVEIVIEHMAIVHSNHSHSMSPLQRKLLSTGVWPSFGHNAEAHTFRIDRVSFLSPEQMFRAVRDQVLHPRSRPRVEFGEYDFMVFGSTGIVKGGGDWYLNADTYMLDGYEYGYHGKVNIHGDGGSQTVSGSGSMTYDVNTHLFVEGTSSWSALFGGYGTGHVKIESNGPDWWVRGDLQTGSVVKCNLTSSKGITVSGDLGPPREWKQWPMDVTVKTPWGVGECWPSMCLISSHGLDVTVRPLTTGLAFEHDFGTAEMWTCSHPVPESVTFWTNMRPEMGNTFCGSLDTLIGTGGFKVQDGELVDAHLEGNKQDVGYEDAHVDRIIVAANLTQVQATIINGTWKEYVGPSEIRITGTPQGNWSVEANTDWIRGYVKKNTLVATSGNVYGVSIDRAEIWSNLEESSADIRVSNETSWLHLKGHAMWNETSWWDRINYYQVEGYISHNISVLDTDISGGINITVAGGGRVLPEGTISLAEGHILRKEIEISGASGTFFLPSGDYYLEGHTHSAHLTSEGYIAFSSTSVEGETYTHYHSDDGKWDQVENSFGWEWGQD